jgi:hypothetical protein
MDYVADRSTFRNIFHGTITMQHALLESSMRECVVTYLTIGWDFCCLPDNTACMSITSLSQLNGDISLRLQALPLTATLRMLQISKRCLGIFEELKIELTGNEKTNMAAGRNIWFQSNK